MPQYVSNGVIYDINDVSSDDCPVAVITSEALEFVQIDIRSRLTKEATGAPLFPDQLQMPSRLVDAINVLEQERRSAEYAKYEAEKERH